ncbi:unnamed protein product [Amoebophrya sp. A120]|nr:unnamed protein product [Amoebophrya sp. A120]|eukprot:GSA120T00003275001.1
MLRLHHAVQKAASVGRVEQDAVNKDLHLVQVVPPSVAPPAAVPLASPLQKHLVLVVDVSGSMGTAVAAVNESGEKENHGYSILDLVKHSLLTVIQSLAFDEESEENEGRQEPQGYFEYQLSLITFTRTASVVFSKLSLRNAAAKKRAEEAVAQLRPESTTNLWAGLKLAVDRILLPANSADENYQGDEDDAASTTTGSSSVRGGPTTTTTVSDEPDAEPGVLPAAARRMNLRLQERNAGSGATAGTTTPYEDLLAANTSTEVWVFTDGQPNQVPPQGHVKTLETYLEKKKLPQTAFTLRTFGFGYCLDAKLLEDLAKFGNGSFCFIPDGSFVGTVFIHALASLQNTVPARALTLRAHVLQQGEAGKFVAGPRGDENHVVLLNVLGAKGLHDVSRRGYLVPNDGGRAMEMSVPLGSTLEYGQSRELVFEIPHGVTCTFSLEYFDLRTMQPVTCQTTWSSSTQEPPVVTNEPVALFQHARARLLAVDALDYLVNEGLPGFGVESGNPSSFGGTAGVSSGRTPTLEQKAACVADTVRDIKTNILAQSNGDDDVVLPLLQDLEGQVAEAVSRQDWFKRWGEYYLRSLKFAHVLQKRNNFKDPGVQGYGKIALPVLLVSGDVEQGVRSTTSAFDGLVERVTDVFVNQVEAPKPSKTYDSSAHSGPISMAAYNNARGPCFTPDCLVQLFDGSLVRVDQVAKGMYVRSGLQHLPMRVKCVVETAGPGMKILRFGKQLNNLGVTPYHPVCVSADELRQIGATSTPRSVASDSTTSTVADLDADVEIKTVVSEQQTEAVVATPMLNNDRTWVFPIDLVSKMNNADKSTASFLSRYNNLEHVLTVTDETSHDVVYNFILERPGSSAFGSDNKVSVPLSPSATTNAPAPRTPLRTLGGEEADDKNGEKSQEDHTIVVNGIVTCTLGHGLTTNEKIQHPYFGDMTKVLTDFSHMQGFQEKGVVRLNAQTCCVKDAKSGLVVRMVQ